jgi:hypothetical protein
MELKINRKFNISRERPSESRQQDFIRNENVRLQSALQYLRTGTSGTSGEHVHECVI